MADEHYVRHGVLPPWGGALPGGASTHIDRDLSLPEWDFVRVNASCVCDECGKTYGKHPWASDRDSSGEPWLRVLCDGTKVKC